MNDKNMILNLPNILTLSRLFLIPIFAYALLAENFSARWIAAIVFGLAALTDWFDGFIARKMNQVTKFGMIADHAVDRIFIASAIFTIYLSVRDIIPLWAVLAVVGRDILMVAGWFYLSRHGKQLAITKLGKVSTAFLMVAIFILFTSAYLNYQIVVILGIWLFYIGMLLSLASGLSYLKMGKTIIRNNQAAS